MTDETRLCDQDGKVLAAYPRGALLAFSRQPFSDLMIHALKDEVVTAVS